MTGNGSRRAGPQPVRRNRNQIRGGGPSTGESVPSGCWLTAICSVIVNSGEAGSSGAIPTKGTVDPHWLWQLPKAIQGSAQALAAGLHGAMSSAIAISAMDASWQGARAVSAATGPLRITSIASTPRMAIKCRICRLFTGIPPEVNRASYHSYENLRLFLIIRQLHHSLASPGGSATLASDGLVK